MLATHRAYTSCSTLTFWRLAGVRDFGALHFQPTTKAQLSNTLEFKHVTPHDAKRLLYAVFLFIVEVNVGIF